MHITVKIVIFFVAVIYCSSTICYAKTSQSIVREKGITKLLIQQFGYCPKPCKRDLFYFSGIHTESNKILAYNPGQNFAHGVFGLEWSTIQYLPKDIRQKAINHLYLLSYRPSSKLSGFVSPQSDSWVKLPGSELPNDFMWKVKCALSISPHKVLLVRSNDAFVLQNNPDQNKWVIRKFNEKIGCDLKAIKNFNIKKDISPYVSTKFYDMSTPPTSVNPGESIGFYDYFDWGPIYLNYRYYLTTDCVDCNSFIAHLMIKIWDSKSIRVIQKKELKTAYSPFRIQQTRNMTLISVSASSIDLKRKSFFNVYTLKAIKKQMFKDILHSEKVSRITIFFLILTAYFLPFRAMCKEISIVKPKSPKITVQKFTLCLNKCSSSWLKSNEENSNMHEGWIYIERMAFNPKKNIATGFLGFNWGKIQKFPPAIREMAISHIYLLSFKIISKNSKTIPICRADWVPLPVDELPSNFMSQVNCAISISEMETVLEPIS